MAHCRFCGYWAGAFSDEHDSCATYAANGKTNDEILALRESGVEPAIVHTSKPVKFKTIVWAVFLGMWLFAVSASIVYAILHALISSVQ